MTNETPKAGETWISDANEEWYIIGPCLPDGYVAGQRAHGGGRVTRFDTQTLTGAGNHVVLTHKRPVPLEMWAVVSPCGKVVSTWDEKQQARQALHFVSTDHRIVHLREVVS